MGLCNQFAGEEEPTSSRFILGILEAGVSVALAMYLLLQSNRVAVRMQSMHKDNVALGFLGQGRLKPCPQTLNVFSSRVNRAFDYGLEIANHLACEDRIILKLVSQVTELQIACKPDQAMQMKHSSFIGLHHTKVV